MRFVIFVWLCLVAFASSMAVAQASDAGLERFKAELVRTYNNPAPESIRTLMHPKSLACLQAEPKYERYLMKAETMQAIPGDAKISIQPVAANAALPYRGFTFPLRPSHVVRMEYGREVSSDGRSATTQISEKHIARANNRWYLIFPCPTQEGMGRLREMGMLD